MAATAIKTPDRRPVSPVMDDKTSAHTKQPLAPTTKDQARSQSAKETKEERPAAQASGGVGAAAGTRPSPSPSATPQATKAKMPAAAADAGAAPAGATAANEAGDAEAAAAQAEAKRRADAQVRVRAQQFVHARTCVRAYMYSDTRAISLARTRASSRPHLCRRHTRPRRQKCLV